MAEVATMSCEEIREMLPSYVRGEESLSIRRHIARCPGCRAEVERYAAVTGSLETLRGVTAEPPRHLYQALIAIPQQASRIEFVRDHVVKNKTAYAGVAVAIVGAAGAALWRTRSRRLATA